MPDVVVTRTSLLNMQVCANGETPPERIEEVANAENPSGTRLGWHITTDESLAPVVCSDDPTRLHYILDC